jgi:hypothetical protein
MNGFFCVNAATKSVHPSTSSGRTDFVAAQLPFLRSTTLGRNARFFS